MTTVRTFWHEGTPSLYQRLALKSFTNRGVRVEVFSYDPSANLPREVVRKDAAEVLPPEQVLRFLPVPLRFAVNIDLFRYALLAKLGGWWVDPDVVLLADALPADEVFLAGPDRNGLLSTAVLAFPPEHPVPIIAAEYATANARSVDDWPRAGAPLLTELAERHGLSSLLKDISAVAPVAWRELPGLFEPRGANYHLQGTGPFLSLHYRAWLRAGVPVQSAPPEGCWLFHLLRQHNIDDAGAPRLDARDTVQRLLQLNEGAPKR